MNAFWDGLAVATQRALICIGIAMVVTIPCLSLGSWLMSEPSTLLVIFGVGVYLVFFGCWFQAAWSTWLAVLPHVVSEDAK